MTPMAEFRCPICKKPSRPGNEFFPFCSRRCKLVDLGAWLEDRYRISRPANEADLEAEARSTEAGDEQEQ